MRIADHILILMSDLCIGYWMPALSPLSQWTPHSNKKWPSKHGGLTAASSQVSVRSQVLQTFQQQEPLPAVMVQVCPLPWEESAFNSSLAQDQCEYACIQPKEGKRGRKGWKERQPIHSMKTSSHDCCHANEGITKD